MAINSGSSSGFQSPLPSATTAATRHQSPQVVEVKCCSCGFTEDCTPAYISRVRDRYHGRWICGLCVEAVSAEILRSDGLISTKEALERHISVCDRFRSNSTTALKDTEHPIFAMGRVLRRSLDSPGAPLRSSSNSVLPGVDDVARNGPPLVRSGSCFSALSR